METWKKGVIIFIVFLAFFTYFVKVDYPEYEVTEVKFNKSYSDDEINWFCNLVELRLSGSLRTHPDIFCKTKGSATIQVWLSGPRPIVEGKVLEEPIKSTTTYKQKRLRIIVNGERIY